MTTTIVETMSLPEAAFLLRQKLGPLRNWTDFLTDNIRGQQSIAGLRLLPVAKRRDRSSYRPVYDLTDVMTFIDEVRRAMPSAGAASINTTPLALDRTRHWRTNLFDRDGAPVTKKLSPTTSCRSATH